MIDMYEHEQQNGFYQVLQKKFPHPLTIKNFQQTLVSGKLGILCLVALNDSNALFCVSLKSSTPSQGSDLFVSKIFPIDQQLSCDVKLLPNDLNKCILILSVSGNAHSFTVLNNFAAAVKTAQAQSAFNKASDHKWLGFYRGDKPYLETNMDDEFVERHKMTHSSSFNRDSMLKYELSLKQAEFTHQQLFTIFVGTWNVCGRPPPMMSQLDQLKAWLEQYEEAPDVYAIGIQELDLSKEAFLFNETPREAEWQRALDRAIHLKSKYGQKYNLVAVVRLVGIQLAIMIKNTHFEHVSKVDCDTVGTGILGKMGNKGGVAVSFQLHNTTLCFVNCHLAAHTEEVERRNQDYNDINIKINFRRHPQAIKDHDQIYWMGDLNYRINKLDSLEVKRIITSASANSTTNNCYSLESILKYDQLMEEKTKGKILAGYEEGEINFPPTYKYDINTDVYDSSEKARTPAWTDRIFYKGKSIHLQSYRSFKELRLSDHKPVNALFRSSIGIVDREKFRKIHEDLLKNFDKLENEYLPQVMIDTTDVVFDVVKFGEPQSRDIIVANTGVVPVDFKFIQKNDEKSYCKDWLSIIPNSGRINPAEKCDIRLEIRLEQAQIRLDDILVLHLEGGKDLFITVSAECLQSSFMMSISTLCRLSAPVLNISSEQLKHAENGQLPVLYSVPRELLLLVDYLFKYGLKVRELFDQSALREELIHIRDYLDNGSLDNMPGNNVYAVAESLLLFLSYTKDPIVPYFLHKRCTEVCDSFVQCKEVLDQFPELHRNVFHYICMFLQELLKHAVDNGLDAHSLAVLFGEILLRAPLRTKQKSACRKKTKFIEQFLMNDISTLLPPSK